MCLTMWIEAEASERDRLTSAARAASAVGLRVEVEHPPRWPWAQDRPVRAVISGDGGCACGLLADDADWDAESWSLRPDVVEPLARTLETLLALGPARTALHALWVGERPRDERRVSPAELVAIVRATGLGTRTRYVVERSSPAS